MIFFIVIYLLIAGEIEARFFDNPVLNGNYPEPGAIKVNGTYYIATSGPGYPQISKSTDLLNWETTGNSLIGKTSWHDNMTITAPQIHKVRDNYVLYFTAIRMSSTSVLGGGVADNPWGPYNETTTAIYAPVGDPTFITENSNQTIDLWMIYKSGNSIISRIMAADGLNPAYPMEYTILDSDLDWEEGLLSAPSIFKRGEYYYLLYTGGQPCNNTRSIGVARGTTLKKPFEKRGAPILVSNKVFTEPSQASWVKDLDGVSDTIVFHANLKSDLCGTYSTLMASVGWGSDKWPYVFDF